jgi:hypothetical protein
MRNAAVLANLLVALYLTAMVVAQYLGRDSGSNVIPAVLVCTVVVARALTELPSNANPEK